MKHQIPFDRILEVEDAKVAKLIVRYIFAEHSNTRKPMTDEEVAATERLGIALNLSANFSHSSAVKAAGEAAKITDIRRVCDAFIHGLEPEFTMFRSPLRAYAFCRNLPDHRYVPWQDPEDSPCAICGADRKNTADPVVSGHFVKQQGTSGNEENLISAAWTLNWFSKAEFPTPSQSQFARLNDLLTLIANAPGDYTAEKIASVCSPILGGNKYSRRTFIETLGLAGVLHLPKLPGLLQIWTRWDQRPQYGEMIAPAALWRRSDGLDPTVFAELFPQCRLPRSLVKSTTAK